MADEKHRPPEEAFPATPPSKPSLAQAIMASTKSFLPRFPATRTALTRNRDLHDSLNPLVVQRFKLGLRDYRLYREGIRSFYHVYAAFERTWAALQLPTAAVPPHVATVLRALADPRLTRAPAIALDLDYLYGEDAPAADCPPDRPENIAFVAHIERTLREKPHVLLAYAYLYYMALLAGGKILLRQTLATSDFLPVRQPAATHAEAVTFATNMFCFPSAPSCQDKDLLRTRFKEAMAVAEEGLSQEEKTGFPSLPILSCRRERANSNDRHNRGGAHNLQTERAAGA